MAGLIESLESRMLLSAAPSLSVLAADAKASKAALIVYGKTQVADVKLITADLKAADELKTSKTLLKTLVADGLAALRVTSRGILTTAAIVRVDVSRLVLDSARLQHKPTDAILIAKVSAAATTLQADGQSRLLVLQSDFSTTSSTNGTNLTNLIDANPGDAKLSSDAQTTVSTNTGDARTALVDDLTATLTTDITAVVDAFAA